MTYFEVWFDAEVLVLVGREEIHEDVNDEDHIYNVINN
jgi:hypothetical protein